VKVLVALAFAVRALALPAHSTIDPFGARSMMAVSPRGTVAATVMLGGFSTRVVRWNALGGWHLLALPPLPPAAQSIDLSVAAFDAGGGLLANAVASYSGSIRRLHYVAMRAGTVSSTTVDFGACADPVKSPGPSIAGTYADGDVLATMQSPELVDISDPAGQLAPVAVRLRGTECTYLGNGSVLATAGTYAAGYLGYVGNVPQSPSAVIKQRYEALRWHGDERSVVGQGVALAVAADGTIAGADAPPGFGSTYGIVPHARAWPLVGAAFDLVGGPGLSVAYAIDGRGRVAGMLEDAGGRHHAFVWQDGRLQLLDDLAHAADWRFECAYAFAPDGSIVGIGIYRGTATAFELAAR
jgi:probable HAF family extracellular repeat protein